jgi:hypothetical protein
MGSFYLLWLAACLVCKYRSRDKLPRNQRAVGRTRGWKSFARRKIWRYMIPQHLALIYRLSDYLTLQ